MLCYDRCRAGHLRPPVLSTERATFFLLGSQAGISSAFVPALALPPEIRLRPRVPSDHQHRGSHTRVGSSGVRPAEPRESTDDAAESLRCPDAKEIAGRADAKRIPSPPNQPGTAASRSTGGSCAEALSSTRPTRLSGSETIQRPSRFRVRLARPFHQGVDRPPEDARCVTRAQTTTPGELADTVATLARAATRRTGQTRVAFDHPQLDDETLAAMAMDARHRSGQACATHSPSRSMAQALAQVERWG